MNSRLREEAEEVNALFGSGTVDMKEEPVLEIIPADEEDDGESEMVYPDGAVFDEARRHACLAMLCTTANGPIFDTLVKDARAMELFLIDGSVPSAVEKKTKSTKLGIVS